MLPTWFKNAKLFVAPIHEPATFELGFEISGAEQRFFDLAWLTPRVGAWLDEVSVLGNREAEELVQQTYAWFFEFCDWSKLLPPKLAHVEDMRIVAMRLRGLATKI